MPAGSKHYTKAGMLYTGKTHKMPEELEMEFD